MTAIRAIEIRRPAGEIRIGDTVHKQASIWFVVGVIEASGVCVRLRSADRRHWKGARADTELRVRAAVEPVSA